VKVLIVDDSPQALAVAKARLATDGYGFPKWVAFKDATIGRVRLANPVMHLTVKGCRPASK